MTTENPLFFIPISSGLIFIIVGFILLKFPPKKINGFYGYRTFSSIQNQERWDFAQIYSSKETIKVGLLLALGGLIGLIYHPNEKKWNDARIRIFVFNDNCTLS